MNPESYIKKLESQKGKKVTVFCKTCDHFQIVGILFGGDLPAQPYGVEVKGPDGIASITIRPEDITSLQILPHQTIIDLK